LVDLDVDEVEVRLEKLQEVKGSRQMGLSLFRVLAGEVNYERHMCMHFEVIAIN
jgi:hypothetical protein